VAQGSYDALITHADRAVRRSAYYSYTDAHLALKNSMAACMSFGIKRDWFLARARRFGTSLEAALTDNHIPTDVYNNVLQTFVRNLPSGGSAARRWAVQSCIPMTSEPR